MPVAERNVDRRLPDASLGELAWPVPGCADWVGPESASSSAMHSLEDRRPTGQTMHSSIIVAGIVGILGASP